MSLMEAFDTACRDFPAFRSAVVKARDLAGDAGTRQQLDHLLNTLDQSFGDFKQSFPKAVDSVQASFKQSQEQVSQVEETLAKAKADLAQHEAAMAAKAASVPPVAPEAFTMPPAPPELTPIDFQVGLRLRDELLKRFGARRPRAAASHDDREIWEDWE